MTLRTLQQEKQLDLTNPFGNEGHGKPCKAAQKQLCENTQTILRKRSLLRNTSESKAKRTPRRAPR